MASKKSMEESCRIREARLESRSEACFSAKEGRGQACQRSSAVRERVLSIWRVVTSPALRMCEDRHIKVGTSEYPGMSALFLEMGCFANQEADALANGEAVGFDSSVRCPIVPVEIVFALVGGSGNASRCRKRVQEVQEER